MTLENGVIADLLDADKNTAGLLAAVRENWEHRRAIRQHNAALLKNQPGLAARNAELAIELLEK